MLRPKSVPEERTSLFKFIDLFAGVGGFRRALEPLGGRCVFASEIDVDCQETYARNFGGEHLCGDITEVPNEDQGRCVGVCVCVCLCVCLCVCIVCKCVRACVRCVQGRVCSLCVRVCHAETIENRV